MSATTVELKAASLALIMKVSPESREPRPLLDSAAKLFKPTEVERADRVLFLCESLSLETIAELGKRGPIGRRLRESWHGDVFDDQLPDAFLGPTGFGAFRSDQTYSVLGRRAQHAESKAFKERSWLRRVVLGGGKWVRRRESIEPEFFESFMQIVIDVLRAPDEGEWRALAALERVCHFGWPEGDRDSGVIDELGGVLEARVSPLVGRWELCSVVTEVARSRFLRALAPRFLRVLSEMTEGTASGRYSVSVNPNAVAKASAFLAEIALALEKPVLRGYLRWFAVCFSSYAPRDQAGMEMPNISTEVLTEFVRCTQGSIREGAILLMKGKRTMDLTCLRGLLEHSRDEGNTGRAWAYLLQSRVEGQDSEEVATFLEEILSPATRLPRPVKHAARAAYQKMARTTTVDIKEQEQHLGLPFQGIV